MLSVLLCMDNSHSCSVLLIRADSQGSVLPSVQVSLRKGAYLLRFSVLFLFSFLIVARRLKLHRNDRNAVRECIVRAGLKGPTYCPCFFPCGKKKSLMLHFLQHKASLILYSFFPFELPLAVHLICHFCAQQGCKGTAACYSSSIVPGGLLVRS